MVLTREMAEVISSALHCANDSGQGYHSPDAELRIWQTIGLFFPDILARYLYIPLAEKALQCPLSPST
jgi:hypothetical protein